MNVLTRHCIGFKADFGFFPKSHDNHTHKRTEPPRLHRMVSRQTKLKNLAPPPLHREGA